MGNGFGLRRLRESEALRPGTSPATAPEMQKPPSAQELPASLDPAPTIGEGAVAVLSPEPWIVESAEPVEPVDPVEPIDLLDPVELVRTPPNTNPEERPLANTRSASTRRSHLMAPLFVSLSPLWRLTFVLRIPKSPTDFLCGLSVADVDSWPCRSRDSGGAAAVPADMSDQLALRVTTSGIAAPRQLVWSFDVSSSILTVGPV